MDLTSKEIGFEGLVRELSGDDVIISRLRELGFIRGEKITLQGRAPFGEPLLVRVRGVTVALRKMEAQCIQL